MKVFRILLALFIISLLAAPAAPSAVSAASACASSSPSGGAYTVTVCLTAPADGSTLNGEVLVTATASVTGASPGVQRMVFYLNGDYLLTDYQNPYTFRLPTNRYVDGAYSLQVEALMRGDAFTSQRGGVTVTFDNNVTQPPVNNAKFTPATGTQPTKGAPFVVMAAGDGASGETNMTQVINLIAANNPNMFLYLGDVYENGSPLEFYNWYGEDGINYGRFRSITNPTVGNHEYENGQAPGYFDYWDNIPNYYSFNAGLWHFISLNANSSIIKLASGSPQYTWLEDDLQANPNACTIVFYHEPLFNIGPEGATTALADIWALMAKYHVTLVLNGHDHDYQRWVPLDGSGSPNPGGITEFVAGGGGHGVQTIAQSDSRVAYFNSNNPQAFGALKLSLTSGQAAFQYLSITGATLDSGTIPCANPAADLLPPSVPGGFSAKASLSQVNLSWQAATDNDGVAGYTIYRNGAALDTLAGSAHNYRDQAVQPMTSYTYQIDAFDQVGNHSALSSPLAIMTANATVYIPYVGSN